MSDTPTAPQTSTTRRVIITALVGLVLMIATNLLKINVPVDVQGSIIDVIDLAITTVTSVVAVFQARPKPAT